MIQRWTLPMAVMAAGLLASAGGAQSSPKETHVAGHETAMTRQSTSSQRMGGASRTARRSNRGRVSRADRTFMVQAAQINIGEVQGGRLAHTRAVNASVRDYAQMLIEDHSSANNQLKRLAAQKGVNLPNDTDRKHKAVANRLAKFSGAPFDRAYTRAMVIGHQQAIALFQRYLRTGTDPDVRSYAAKMLPGLRKHLHHARQLANSRAVRTGEKMSPGANMNMGGTGRGAGGERGGDTGGGTDPGTDGGTDTGAGGTDQGTDGGTGPGTGQDNTE